MRITKSLSGRADKIIASRNLDAQLTEVELEEKYLCEQSYLHFVKVFWPILEGRPLVVGWGVEAMCVHLEALYYLWIQQLLVNVPFRCGKSQIYSVLYTGWIWTHNANTRLLYGSYDRALVNRDSRRCKYLIESEKYRRYWSPTTRLRQDANKVTHFENISGGYRTTTSVRSGVTGWGSDLLVLDDPNSVGKAESPLTQKETNDWYDNVLSSRFMDKGTHRKCIVQQRVGRRDLSNHIIEKGHPDLVHLCLPMEFVPEKRCTTIILPGMNKPWEDPRTERNEPFCETRYNPKAIKDIKFEFNNNSYQISCQLQQDPTAPDGGIIREEWFKYYEREFYPQFKYVIQSWDTALTRDINSSFSACTTYGIFEDSYGVRNIMLLGLFAEQIEFPELKKMARRLAHNWEDCLLDQPMAYPPKRKINHIVIEKQVSGHGLFQELFRTGIPVLPFVPARYGKKDERCRLVTDLYENGQVWLPCVPHKSMRQTSWHLTSFSRQFLEAAVVFPASRAGCDTNDIIDSMSQAFLLLKENNWIRRHDLDTE